MQLRNIIGLLVMLAAPLHPAHAQPAPNQTLIGNIRWAELPGHPGCLALQQGGQWLLTSQPRQAAPPPDGQELRRHIAANLNMAQPTPRRTPQRPARTARSSAASTTTALSTPWLLVYGEEGVICPTRHNDIPTVRMREMIKQPLGSLSDMVLGLGEHNVLCTIAPQPTISCIGLPAAPAAPTSPQPSVPMS